MLNARGEVDVERGRPAVNTADGHFGRGWTGSQGQMCIRLTQDDRSDIQRGTCPENDAALPGFQGWRGNPYLPHSGWRIHHHGCHAAVNPIDGNMRTWRNRRDLQGAP